MKKTNQVQNSISYYNPIAQVLILIFDFSSSPSGDGGHDSEYGSDLDDEDDDGDNDYCDGDDENETFIAMMIVFALSSAPCLELFSAAPAENNFKLQKRFQTLSFQKAIADGF